MTNQLFTDKKGIMFNNSYSNSSSNSPMYTSYASYYDQFYHSKNYTKEALFLDELFSSNNVKTILDVGCGTGTHIALLEHYGYVCQGIDLNRDMLNIAKNKVKGPIFQADMRNFDLVDTFDAVICLFAVFNHNLCQEDALKTLLTIKKHLAIGGLLVLDLYNPQSSGKKTEKCEEIERIMKWDLDHSNQICTSIVQFVREGNICESIFPLKIYSMLDMQQLLEKAGFKNINFYENYSWENGTSRSKNLIVTAYLS